MDVEEASTVQLVYLVVPIAILSFIVLILVVFFIITLTVMGYVLVIKKVGERRPPKGVEEHTTKNESC